MNDRFDIVVVGAGGGGAVLGLALAQRGIPVLVLERQAGAPSAVRGETIQPNGQQILDRLGILKDLSSDAVLPLQRFHFAAATLLVAHDSLQKALFPSPLR